MIIKACSNKESNEKCTMWWSLVCSCGHVVDRDWICSTKIDDGFVVNIKKVQVSSFGALKNLERGHLFLLSVTTIVT